MKKLATLCFTLTFLALCFAIAPSGQCADPELSQEAQGILKRYSDDLEKAYGEAIVELQKEEEYQKYLESNPALASLQRMTALSKVDSKFAMDNKRYLDELPVMERLTMLSELMRVGREVREKVMKAEDEKAGVASKKPAATKDESAPRSTRPRASQKTERKTSDSEPAKEPADAPKPRPKKNGKDGISPEYDKAKAEYVDLFKKTMEDERRELEEDEEYQKALEERPSLARLQRLEVFSDVHMSFVHQLGDELLEQLPPDADRMAEYDEIADFFQTIRDNYVEGNYDASENAARAAEEPKKLPKLKVSDNKRFLVTEKGDLFFWTGDTAWELFHRTTKEEAQKYLTWRRLQGFNVIQAVAVAELGGLDVPNRYGFCPFVDAKTPKPLVKDGPDNDYWDYVDYVIDEANNRGLYVGLLPTWGAWWKEGGIFTPENAGKYGEWLGKRYKDKGIVWILGGDRTIDTEKERATVEALAQGLKRGDGGVHLMTFHPTGGRGSSEYFHSADWLDFNMRQNGHNLEYASYKGTADDYDLKPTKPVIDGEPIYEDHPISFDPDRLGHSLAADVRRAFYWDVFNGAAGHTYGHHSVWQFYDPKVEGREPVNRPLMAWQDAINRPGSDQINYGRKLMESRPGLTRIPDPMLVYDDEYASAVPGAGTRRVAATRDAEGSYAFIYVPVGRKITVNTSLLESEKLTVFWFDPSDGESYFGGVVDNEGKQVFTPPFEGELNDLVLVLDDPRKNYPDPGSFRHTVRTIVVPAGARTPFMPPLLPPTPRLHFPITPRRYPGM